MQRAARMAHSVKKLGRSTKAFQRFALCALHSYFTIAGSNNARNATHTAPQRKTTGQAKSKKSTSK